MIRDDPMPLVPIRAVPPPRLEVEETRGTQDSPDKTFIALIQQRANAWIRLIKRGRKRSRKGHLLSKKTRKNRLTR
jgi:hypothetical protein